MTDVSTKLNAIAAGQDQKAKAEQYKDVLSQVINAASVEGCRLFVDHSECLEGLRKLQFCMNRHCQEPSSHENFCPHICEESS